MLLSQKRQEGKRFGFVRFDCEVAAEVAMQKLNGLLIQDKDLRVKKAEFGRKDRRFGTAEKKSDKRLLGSSKGAGKSEEIPDRIFQGGGVRPSGRESYANVVRREGGTNDSTSTVRVETIGNRWLYRSAVATFGEYRNPDLLFESFVKAEGNGVIARRLGRVLNIEDDTAKGARYDIGKIKVVFTQSALAINSQMNLLVGQRNFKIRVAEEQAVFINSSDFSCGCLYHIKEAEQSSTTRTSHGREDEQLRLVKVESPDVDVNNSNNEIMEGGNKDSISGDGRGSLSSFVEETQLEDGCRMGGLSSLGEEEMRGCALGVEANIDNRNNGSLSRKRRPITGTEIRVGKQWAS
ncbi:hypothetical protein Dimus_031171 [Dionaea muscipula]